MPWQAHCQFKKHSVHTMNADWAPNGRQPSDSTFGCQHQFLHLIGDSLHCCKFYVAYM